MRIFQIILFILISTTSFCQEVEIKRPLQVSGYIFNEKVLLRWAPEDNTSWQRGNKLGYSVFRKVVMRDGKVLNNVDSTLIGNLLPLPIKRWKPYADSSYFAVAAEAIFGNEFDVTTQSNSFLDMVNKSREQDSRFSIGLLCADQSFTVACMMGLGLVDSAVKKNEVYLYKVVLNYRDSTGPGETGYALVDFGFGNFLPRPFGIDNQVVDSSITIMVPYEPFKGIYTTFELQRSDDSIDYHTVKDKTFYSLSTTPEDPKYNLYTDSVGSLTTTVYYRLRGRTPFDTYGPFSDTISVKIMPSLSGEPWITDIIEVGIGKITVSWETPVYKKENLKGFMVYSSKYYDGPYISNLKSLVGTDSKIAVLEATDGYAYLRVGALDQFNRPYFSAPRLYQAVDSIPPSAPLGLTGEFDTTGVVNLKWNYGKERDLLGYQILYSANSDMEYSLISKVFIYDSAYMASFPVDMLSSDIYFKVVALDTRYNTSKASLPLKLVKPDKIPPSAPVIFLEMDSAGLTKVSIAPSASTDVLLYHLYYLPETDNPEKAEIFRGIIKSDTTIILNDRHGIGELYCVAEDVTGRFGTSNKVLLKQINDNNNPTFNALAKPLIDEGVVELLWDKTNLSGSTMIYRKDDVNSYSLIATVDTQSGIFKDRNVIINTSYTYKLIVFQKDGKAISKIVVLRYY